MRPSPDSRMPLRHGQLGHAGGRCRSAPYRRSVGPWSGRVIGCGEGRWFSRWPQELQFSKGLCMRALVSRGLLLSPLVCAALVFGPLGTAVAAVDVPRVASGSAAAAWSSADTDAVLEQLGVLERADHDDLALDPLLDELSTLAERESGTLDAVEAAELTRAVETANASLQQQLKERAGCHGGPRRCRRRRPGHRSGGPAPVGGRRTPQGADLARPRRGHRCGHGPAVAGARSDHGGPRRRDLGASADSGASGTARRGQPGGRFVAATGSTRWGAEVALPHPTVFVRVENQSGPSPGQRPRLSRRFTFPSSGTAES